MKLLTRDTSAFRFLTLGGLLSKHDFLETIQRDVPPEFQDANYRPLVNGFGVNEENVRRFVMNLLRSLRWETVEREHDVVARFGEESLLVECKRHDSRLLYIDEHRGGSPGETAVEELQRNLVRTGIKWGLLTDGVTFRFIYNSEIAPDLFDCYLEFSLKDMVDSTHRWPFEMSWLVDFLIPVSLMRRKDPTRLNALSKSHLNKILRVLKDEPRGLHTVIKSLAVAALEDMGVRPLHTEIQSIRDAVSKDDFLAIFSEIESDDPDFHKEEHFITNPLCNRIHEVLADLSEVDLSHVDHEFFGIVYQKFINNGNASHYTSTKLSREMANYIACRSNKSQMPNARSIYLEDNDYILDPALGSGQLLRGLLPFHRVFFQGNSSGVDGWRRLAGHFMGRDIDEQAIWIAKINIWLATADKGEPLVRLDEFKPLDVIESSVERRAGGSIREALNIDDGDNVAAVVCNPPWDVFKKYQGRNEDVTSETKLKIRRSLAINTSVLNRAQIFVRIIQLLGDEFANMRFSVILPDNFFVDQNTQFRQSILSTIDFYFSYPRNLDPISKKPFFADIDRTRKFGIIFGRSQTNFAQTFCYPIGANDAITITPTLSTIGDHQVLPLFSHHTQAALIEKWKAAVTRNPSWKDGEFNQGTWRNRAGRIESENGRYYVVGGSSFTTTASPWSKEPERRPFWKRFSDLAESDHQRRTSDRTVFSDYINNSKKLNSAAFLPGDLGVCLIDTVLYSTECLRNDYLIYDSMIFSSFVEVYGTSQHMNSWRLSALGLPPRLNSQTSLAANVEICRVLQITLQEALNLYELNRSWIESAVSLEQWRQAVAELPAGRQERQDLQRRVGRNRRVARPARQRNQR